MLFVRLLAFAAAALISGQALAAEITRHPNDSATLNAIYLRGIIQPGDAEKLRAYIADLPKKASTAIYLNSDGGSFRDGINMGYMFRSDGIRTVVEGNSSRCMSACAFAFLGGFDKKTERPWRAKSSTSRLSFHSAYPKLSKTTYSPEEANELLRGGNVVAAMLITYFDAVDADWSLLAQTMRTRPSQFYDVTNEQALEIGINVWDETSKKLRLAESSKAY